MFIFFVESINLRCSFIYEEEVEIDVGNEYNGESDLRDSEPNNT